MTTLVEVLLWLAVVGFFVGAIWLTHQSVSTPPPRHSSGLLDGDPFYEEFKEIMYPDTTDDEVEAEFIAWIVSEFF